MIFDTVKSAQKEVVKILQNSMDRQRLSHAYIFEGEAGTKKFDTALFFAARLLCEKTEDKPCGTCHNCRRIVHQTHPNLYIVRPTRRTILKESILALQEEFNKTAVEPGAKVYIIDQADTMNQYASNALLKFLEEPHPNLYAVLLTTDAQKLLPTIRSRSQLLHFHSLSESIIIESLIKDGYEDKLARLAAASSHTITEAEHFLSQPKLFDYIDIVESLYEAMTNQQSLVIKFQEQSFDVMTENVDFLQCLSIMIHYQKDVIYGKMKHYKKIIFKDQQSIIESVANQKSKAMLLEELEMMLTLKTKLSQYINERLAFDNLLLALERRMDREE